jgi:ACT domain-containing protein
LELKDVPGQLLRALEPIARFGGNIQSIIHQRERKTPLGRVPVMLVFEIGSKSGLRKILEALRSRDIFVAQVGERLHAVKHTVLLLGHIVHADIRTLVDKINSIQGVRVLDLSLAMGEAGLESSARLTLASDDEARARTAVAWLSEFSKRKNLLLITSLGVES